MSGLNVRGRMRPTKRERYDMVDGWRLWMWPLDGHINIFTTETAAPIVALKNLMRFYIFVPDAVFSRLPLIFILSHALAKGGVVIKLVAIPCREPGAPGLARAFFRTCLRVAPFIFRNKVGAAYFAFLIDWVAAVVPRPAPSITKLRAARCAPTILADIIPAIIECNFYRPETPQSSKMQFADSLPVKPL